MTVHCQGSQGSFWKQGLKQTSWRNTTCSPWLAQPVFLYNPPTEGQPLPLTNKMPYSHEHGPIWWEVIPQMRLSFSQVCVKLTTSQSNVIPEWVFLKPGVLQGKVRRCRRVLLGPVHCQQGECSSSVIFHKLSIFQWATVQAFLCFWLYISENFWHTELW